MKKERYLQIFNYLLEFSKLRSNPVRDIESSDTQYPDKIWFADIPQYDIFDCITFPNYNQDADYWLKIAKPKSEPQQPLFPKLSETLSDWVEKSSLADESGMPTLKESISKSGKTILRTDKPEVEAEFQNYLNEKWINDLEFFKKQVEEYEVKLEEYEKQSKTYKHLFSIYNKALQFGEEYELIVGVGLLHFQESSSSPLICRHILTSKAEITFEFSARESFVKVSPSIDNEIQIETDAILDLLTQFDSADIIEAEKKVVEFLKEKNITDSPFDNQIYEAIQIFADRIRTDGQSKDDLAKSKTLAQKPIVYFAPALLLRKRNTRSFTALYEKIIEDISASDESIDIPSINDIIGYIESTEDFQSDSGNKNSGSAVDETIYFPKKYNDEQIEIIEKARLNKKVLVQGPPGTGKSHTIANLICHLLANGKKVLVTAYTKRALEVLKNQLPPDFQNLTVNLLSGDSTSIQDLDASVNAINDELSKVTNLNSFKEEIEEKVIELTLLKEQKANTKNEWLKVKEKSTRRQNINRNYQGTLLEIAERIEKETPTFSWFKDEFADITKINLIADVENFNSLTRKYESIDTSVFNFIVPQKEKLLSVQELKDYHRIAAELVQKYSSKEEHLSIRSNNYPELKKLLQELRKLFSEIENNIVPFKAKLIADFRNSLFVWKDKLSRTDTTLAELADEKLKQFDRGVEIKYPTDKSLIVLKSDAEFLLQALNDGKRLKGPFSIFNPFSSSDIKGRQYFIKGVQVNNSDCDTIAEFQTVLGDIKIKQDFEELETIWELKANGNSKSYSDRAKFYRQLKTETETLINFVSESTKLKTQIESVSSIKIQDYDSSKVIGLIDDCDYSYLLSQIRVFKAKISEAERHLSNQNIHPVAVTISKTIANIDVENYEQQIIELDRLNGDKEDYFNFKNLKEKLIKHFPTTIKEIWENTFDISNFRQLDNAIHFKHAFVEISKLLEEDYESTLVNRLSEIERQEDKLVSKVASMKAWDSVLSSLISNPLLRRHLQAWVLAQSRIGQGTGIRAARFRKEAQNQMEKCKDSVPCWIMPLYKVAETIKPEKEMYDYVIIDEASQLGADAIFLLYISKNIIIVGDDKQTSPEYVGVNANTMTPHINRHLNNIPFANYYGTDFSFFDHAKMFCNGVTVLREHFRCMPEIIEFCNKYFYAPDGKGLYPLKQYSEDRLTPLEHKYCQSGYIEGTYQNITNRVEAEAIANKISELVSDERYFKIEEGNKKPKTIGVIALQGNRQAEIIDSLILKKIGEAEYKKRKIICGNSASFQGDERDIMFLSLITAYNHRRQAMTDDNDKRRFNVAVSRAKEQVWLFHSVMPDDLSNHNDLRWKLLNHFLNYKPQPIPNPRPFERTIGTQPDPFESWFEVDVYNDIVTNNYSVIPQYEVAKGRYRIDLVALLSNGVKIAIECDGDKFHGAAQFQNDLMRQRVLERCGWQFVRIRGAEYYSNRKKALEPLWKKLRENDIQYVELPITNNHSQNGQEIIVVEEEKETLQPQVQRPVATPNKKVEMPDLFKTEIQTTLTFGNVEQADNKMKVSSNLFSFPEILVFTSNHNVYKVQNRGLTNLSQLNSEIEFEAGEKPIYFTGTKNYSGFLIVGFENGKAGKISMHSFQTEHNRKKLKNAYNDESKLIFIEYVENDIDLVALSNIKKVVLFNTSKINPVDSRTTKGVQVMKQKNGSYMTKLKKSSQVKLQDPDYYRKDESLNVVGYYLKQGDEV